MASYYFQRVCAICQRGPDDQQIGFQQWEFEVQALICTENHYNLSSSFRIQLRPRYQVETFFVDHHNSSLPPGFLIHQYCLSSLTYEDVQLDLKLLYRLCLSLRPEENSEHDFDRMIDVLDLCQSLNPFDYFFRKELFQKPTSTISSSLAPQQTMEISRIAELLRNLPYDVSYMILQYLTPTDLAMWSYVHANLKAIIDAFCNRGRMKRFITSVGPSWATIRHHIVADESSKTGDRTTNLWIVFSNGQTIQQLFPDLRQYNPERNRELSLCKLAQPIIFFTRWIQSYQYLCGFRLSDGSILGVKSESPHYTQVTLGREDQISLCIDGRGIKGLRIGQYYWEGYSQSSSGWTSCWSVDTIPQPFCVFDGCKLRILAKRAISSNQLSNFRSRVFLKHSWVTEQSIIDEANYVTTKSHLEGELSLLAVEMIPLPKKAGRITFFFRNSTSFIQGIEVYSDSIRQLTGSKDGYAINFSYSDQESIQRIEVRVPNNTIMRSLDLKFYTDRRQFSFAPLSTDGYKTRVLQPKANESLTGFILRRAKCQGHVVSFGIVCEEKERTDQNSNKNRRYTLLKNTSQTYQDRTSIMTGDILQGIKHCTFQHFAKLTQVERIGWFLDEKNRCRGLQLYYRDGSVEETLGRWQQNQPVIKWLKDDEEIIAILIKHSTRSQYTVEEISFETTLGRRLGPDQSDQYQLHYPVGENSVLVWCHNLSIDIIRIHD